MEVGSMDEKKYFLDLKNQQYFKKNEQSLLYKMCSIIKVNNEYKEICVQVIEELLKDKCYSNDDIEMLINFDIETDNPFDNIGIDISNLVAFYWDFDQNLSEFKKFKSVHHFVN